MRLSPLARSQPGWAQVAETSVRKSASTSFVSQFPHIRTSPHSGALCENVHMSLNLTEVLLIVAFLLFAVETFRSHSYVAAGLAAWVAASLAPFLIH